MRSRFWSREKQAADDTTLERELRGLLRREDPPPGFAGRVLAQAERPRFILRAGLAAGLRRRAPALGAAAALLAVGVYLTAGAVHRRQIEAQRAAAARAQLQFALEVTAGDLNWAEANLHAAEPSGAARPAAPRPARRKEPR